MMSSWARGYWTTAAGHLMKYQNSFAMSIATTLSEGAWVLQNYGKTTRVLLILNTLGALIFMLISIGINRVAYRKINQLED